MNSSNAYAPHVFTIPQLRRSVAYLGISNERLGGNCGSGSEGWGTYTFELISININRLTFCKNFFLHNEINDIINSKHIRVDTRYYIN